MKSDGDLFFSVIIPTYNRAHIIGRAIRSVFNQSYNYWELIIVDDASTDNTEDVLTEYDGNENVEVIYREENGGNASARNDGVRIANGDIIAFLDSDDEFLSDYLLTMNELIKKSSTDTGIYWTGCKLVDENEKDIGVWKPDSKYRNNPNHFLYELHKGTSGLCLKRECFDYHLFDEKLRTAVDHDYLIRIRKLYKFAYTERTVFVMHRQDKSVRTNILDKWKAYTIIIGKHRDIIDNDCRLVHKWYYKLMWLSYYTKHEHTAKEAFDKIRSNCSVGIRECLLYMTGLVLSASQIRRLHHMMYRIFSE